MSSNFSYFFTLSSEETYVYLKFAFLVITLSQFSNNVTVFAWFLFLPGSSYFTLYCLSFS